MTAGRLHPRAFQVAGSLLLLARLTLPIEGRAQTTAATKSKTTGAQVVPVVEVRSQVVDRQISLPGELVAFQDVQLHSKVQGFVQSVNVDRGSIVRKGQLLVKLVAPEIDAQRSEADAKVQSAQAQRIEAEAKLAADEATYQHLKSASSTPGVVPGNDLEVAQRTVDADRARVDAWTKNEQAASDSAKSIQQMDAYLQITAPFDGVITERNVHEGALVGPSSAPMLRLQEIARLRLVVSVPETEVAGVRSGESLRFTVPAFPSEWFSGTVQRVGRAVDTKTRTMAVELDVTNRDNRLAPGMYSQVEWHARRTGPSFLVPPTAVATTTEKTFVVRINQGVVEWVEVKKGASLQGALEIFGPLKAGDQVAVRGTDELRPGTRVQPRLANTK
jgi:RND family efflux transporter MFP subunit